MSVFHKVWLAIYYSIGSNLPKSSLSSTSRKFRYFLVKRIFKKCGVSVNVDKGAYFGNGKGIVVGNYSGIGEDCNVQGVVSMGDHVMMGPEVRIITRSHKFSKTDVPMTKQGFDVKPVIIEMTCGSVRGPPYCPAFASAREPLWGRGPL